MITRRLIENMLDTRGAGKAFWQVERPIVKKLERSIQFHSLMISYKKQYSYTRIRNNYCFALDRRKKESYFTTACS